MPFELTRQLQPDKPILFSVPMVLALLDGTKNQTRRIVTVPDGASIGHIPCPYGQVGHYLWVREAWAPSVAIHCFYRATHEKILADDGWNGPWKPGIHMHRYRSRITLKITRIRMEPLQSISDSDALGEGIERDTSDISLVTQHLVNGSIHCDRYARLWDSIHGVGAWAKNPMVWAINFEVIKKNIDEVLRG